MEFVAPRNSGRRCDESGFFASGPATVRESRRLALVGRPAALGSVACDLAGGVGALLFSCATPPVFPALTSGGSAVSAVPLPSAPEGRPASAGVGGLHGVAARGFSGAVGSLRLRRQFPGLRGGIALSRAGAANWIRRLRSTAPTYVEARGISGLD